jgi:hypothetical protein
MDAFSRLLAAIGQSLGKGLGKVGETELEQRQRLEALEFQRRANISGQLLQTFTQLLQTQGIQEVEPGGIDAIRQAVTDLALGKIDSPAIQRAIEVFPRVAASANKLSVYKELATRDIDALSRIIVNTDPKEAQSLLGAIGLQGLYEGLRARGEILTQADKLGLKLTEEQIESLAAQRQALLAELGPRIRLLEAQGKLTEAQTKRLLEILPLELTNLQLQAQKLGIDIAKGEKELARFDQLLDLTLEKLATEIGLTKEQTNLLREQIRTEVLRQAQIEAETELKKAEIELKRMQAKEIADTLGPRIQEMIARTDFYKAQTDEARARTKAILDRLPLELENLLLDIKRKGIELERLPDLLDAELKKRFAEIGLTEAQTGLTKEQIDLVREQTKNEILKQLRTEAETERIRAETEEIRERTRTLIDKHRLEMDERRQNLFENALKVIYAAQMTDPKEVKSYLSSIGSLREVFADEKLLDSVSESIVSGVKDYIYEKALRLTQEEAKAIDTVVQASLRAASPSAAKELAMLTLPKGMSEEKKKMIGNMAAFINAAASGKLTAEVIESFTKFIPPKESRSGILRVLYDTLAGMHDGTEWGMKQASARANAIVNTIKYTWDYDENLRNLQKLKLISETELNQAKAAHERVLAELGPKQLDLKWQEFKLEDWYKREWIKINWAKIDLERLELQAKQSGAKDETIQNLKTLAETANKLYDGAVRTLQARLYERKFFDCGNELGKQSSINISEIIQGKDLNRCNQAVADILENPKDEKDRDVIRAFVGAINAQLAVNTLFNALIGGNALPVSPTPGGFAQPGGTTAPGSSTPANPGGAGFGGTTTPGSATPARPGGTSTTTQGRTLFSPPKTGGFESGVRKAYNTLFRQFGVKQPQDLIELGGMIFLFGNEVGPANNPLQVLESSGVPMETIKVKEGDKVVEKKKPIGPDFGFRAAIKADRDGRGARQRALDIDSAIALGIAWIFPNEAWQPRMLASKIREDFRRANHSLFEEANLFASEGGFVDITSLAAAYAARSLKRLGVEVVYTPQFTKLLRALAEHDLGTLTSGKIPSKKDDERAFVDKVMRMYGERYQELRFDSKKQLEEAARKLYWATRLSNIGNLAIGGVR